MARVLICGTLAYDLIGRFSGRLEAHTRNVKLDSMVHSFGGCAMNMAYNLRQLGHEPVALVYAGDNFVPDYEQHLSGLGISSGRHHSGTRHRLRSRPDSHAMQTEPSLPPSTRGLPGWNDIAEIWLCLRPRITTA